MTRIDELRALPRERTLYPLALAISIFAWVLLGLSIVGAICGWLIVLFILVSHALYLAYVHGNGVRLSEHQLHEILHKVQRAAHELGMAQPPETYVLQSGGILNALATRFLGRKFIILYSYLLDKCDPRTNELDFVIGHEVGHLAAGHLKWYFLPARATPSVRI